MGLTTSKLFDQKEIKALMLGLNSTGKTTILYKLKFGDATFSIPTIGFSVETLEYKGIRINVCELTGQTKPLWKHYSQDLYGLIFVVDSSDRERIELARQELHKVLQVEETRDAVLLVIANKQDMGVMSVAEVTEKLGLESIKERQWHIQGTCATTREGLHEGFEWLCESTKGKKSK